MIWIVERYFKNRGWFPVDFGKKRAKARELRDEFKLAGVKRLRVCKYERVKNV